MLRKVVLYNPGASSATSESEVALREGLALLGDVEFLELDERFTVARLDELAANADTLIAAGGDGTVSALLPVAMRRELPVLVVPLGTSSSFSRALGIQDREHALSLLTEGTVRAVDVALVNERPMVLLAALGLHADAVGNADRDLKATFGSAAYVMEFLSSLAKAEHFDVEITVGAQRFQCTSTAVTVANAARPGALLAQGQGDVVIDDGLLDVTIVLGSTSSDILVAGLELARGALSGEGVEGRNVLSFRTSELTLRPSTPRPLLIDGELLDAVDEVHIALRPAGLRVFAPPPPAV